ncbi:MAG: L-serine ammonia-lyase, iron-sulfur-dependent, subunit alpha [Spirochaetaceae bacterium]|jgi:L-serine dehydratase|nr:L-serine ammonia-lyase, iron-sulfur-dependent, subunit alpha [Spirochaetaceae bacterium]
MIDYNSLAAIVHAAEEKGLPISETVLQDQAENLEKSPDELMQEMQDKLDVMRRSAKEGEDEKRHSASGLSGGDSYKLSLNDGISGPFCHAAIRKAIAIAEYNASMGKIVAAPTAGSCGIVPGAILAYAETKLATQDDNALCLSLFTAGAVGMVIAKRATLAGAEGGCQAECGSAAAMAAAALTELAGGSARQAGEAAALAIKSILGLVCDPVGGLVEVPCIKRNASSVMIAIGAAEMALAGIESRIPVDEVIDAMDAVGRSISQDLRETARGGLAATPTAQHYPV